MAEMKLITKLYCSFCGKSQHEVRKLIAGPTVFICDECVVLCSAIVAETEADDRLRQRMAEKGEFVVNKQDAERLAWMRTWTVSATESAQHDGAPDATP